MRYAIVGLGGIGTSIGLTVRQAEPSAEVVGYDRDPQASVGALSLGALTETAAEITACARADLLILATPPSALPELFRALDSHLAETAILTDVASVKSPVLGWAREHLSRPERFVGGHPIAGTEQSGWQSARAGLFQSAQWVLTPTENTAPDALATVQALVRKIGATPLLMDAEQHDREMALLSHLPHAVAFSLSALHKKQPTNLQGGSSWQSATRVAQSDPSLWSEIFYLNRNALADTLRQFRQELNELLTLLEGGDVEAIRHWLQRARKV